MDDNLTRLWSVRLPRLADPWAPRLADAFADGVWTARRPMVSALAPPVAFLAGLFFSILWPGMKTVYTESLIFMTIVIAGAILSGPAGVMLMAGYVIGDFVPLPSSIFRHWQGADLVRQMLGALVIYMLLALPAVVLPQIGRKMSEEIASRVAEDGSGTHFAIRAGLYATAMGILTFLWCQAMIVLVRPIFTYVNRSPTTEAVMQVQRRWIWLAVIAAAAAIVRTILESLERRGRAGDRIRSLEQQRWSAPQTRGALWRRVPLVVRVAIAAMVATLMLSGTFVTVIDGVFVFAAILAVKGWRTGLFGSIPPWWIRTVSAIPTFARFVAAPLLGYVMAYAILVAAWRSASLRPVMLGALLTFLFVQLLFPRVEMHPRPQENAS